MQSKLFCGLTYYYEDDLFLGDDKRSTCPFAEFFTNNDPESVVFCWTACHLVGMIDNNPARKCGGDPFKCPLTEGKVFSYINKVENYHVNVIL